MSYFIYTDFISTLLDPRLVVPGSTLIGTYDPSTSSEEVDLYGIGIVKVFDIEAAANLETLFIRDWIWKNFTIFNALTKKAELKSRNGKSGKTLAEKEAS